MGSLEPFSTKLKFAAPAGVKTGAIVAKSDSGTADVGGGQGRTSAGGGQIGAAATRRWVEVGGINCDALTHYYDIYTI